MKLTNPTDPQLNEAFAVKVAGWKFRNGEFDANYNETSPAGWYALGGVFCGNIKFTESAETVFRYLEEGRDAGRRVHCEMGFARWRIWIHDKQPSGLYLSAERPPDGDADTFPRAAVIALLRVNGVQVEFTQ